MPSLQGSWPREFSVSLCCLPLLPSNKFRSQVGRWGISDARSTAWRPQKMTASRCMNRRIRLFGLCATADGEINAGWTSYGRFVWFPQCHVYISLGFLLQSWPPYDPGSRPFGLSCNLSALLLILGQGVIVLQPKGLLSWLPPLRPCQLSAQI